MVNCYPKEYLDEYDVLEESWDTTDDQDAKKKRDRRARELRRQGWNVQTETLDYSDLSRSRLYRVVGERKK